MRQQVILGAAAALILAAAAGCSDDPTDTDLETNFMAELTGAAERPDPVTTSATGSATVTINDAAQTLTFSITVSNLLSPTFAHIHTGSTAVAGPVAVTLLGTAPAPGIFNGVLTSGTVGVSAITGETFATLVAKIRSGNAYINVHTVANTGGEIRGQLIAQ